MTLCLCTKWQKHCIYHAVYFFWIIITVLGFQTQHGPHTLPDDLRDPSLSWYLFSNTRLTIVDCLQPMLMWRLTSLKLTIKPPFHVFQQSDICILSVRSIEASSKEVDTFIHIHYFFYFYFFHNPYLWITYSTQGARHPGMGSIWCASHYVGTQVDLFSSTNP